MASKEQKLNIGLWILLAIAFFYFFQFGNLGDTMDRAEPVTEWQTGYKESAEASFPFYESYIENTDYYDYNNEIIATVADEIAASSSSSKEAIEKTLDYVYENVRYTWGEPDNACFDGKAPQILESGSGQCDTQSMVVISLLRRQGIAAVPVGGCIVVNQAECLSQSLYLQSFQFFGLAPKFTTLEDIRDDQETFSRGISFTMESMASREEEGRTSPKGFSRNGGLHAWVTAWTPEEGWITLESTTGTIADTQCYIYHVEIFPDNNEKEDLCVSKSYDYAKACQIDDIANLDLNGIGSSTEVNPNE